MICLLVHCHSLLVLSGSDFLKIGLHYSPITDHSKTCVLLRDCVCTCAHVYNGGQFSHWSSPVGASDMSHIQKHSKMITIAIERWLFSKGRSQKLVKQSHPRSNKTSATGRWWPLLQNGSGGFRKSLWQNGIWGCQGLMDLFSSNFTPFRDIYKLLLKIPECLALHFVFC